METNNIIIKQTLQRGLKTPNCFKHYKVIAVINDLCTTKIQLIAFRLEEISLINVRLDFCDKFNIPAPIGNMVCKLSRMKFF
jgi:hypothetical protein